MRYGILLLGLAFLGCARPDFRDSSLPSEQRAELLLQELTLEEKISLMMDVSKPVERLGIKPYNWWNEALHGVARAGLATVFPQSIGMAASFNDSLVYEVFTAVSDEARAKNVYYASKGSYERYQGLQHHQYGSSVLLLLLPALSNKYRN
jgi:beta-glucosidase